MSYNGFHRLKPENPGNKNLESRTVFGYDSLGNRVPVDSYWISVDVEKPTDSSNSQINHSFPDQTELNPTYRKRQTGGVISSKHFPSR